MKLCTVNQRMDNFNMETLLSKDILQSPQSMVPLDSLALALPYDFQMPSNDGFGGSSFQIPALWEDDLHSLIQMAFHVCCHSLLNEVEPCAPPHEGTRFRLQTSARSWPLSTSSRVLVYMKSPASDPRLPRRR